MRRLFSSGLGLERFSGLYLWALLIVVFTIWQPALFPTAATVHVEAAQYSVTGLLALGVLVPLVTGSYDLSIGSVANLSTIVVIWLQTTHHVAVLPAILITLGVSALIGAFNGFVVVKLGVNSFIATLGVATIVEAVQTIVSGNVQPLPATSPAFLDLTQTQVFGFQLIFGFLIVAAFVFWWLLDFTPAGRNMYAIGGNADAARLSGVRVGKWTWLSLVVSGTMAGLAGVLYGSLSGPSLTYGQSLLLPAFAAVFLGSTQLQPGRFNVWGTLLAIYVLGTGVQGLSYVTGVQWLNDMFNGVALIVAVAFAAWRERASQRRSFLYPGEPDRPEAEGQTVGPKVQPPSGGA